MPKNIVICLDGTRASKEYRTNIEWIHRHTSAGDFEGRQISRYFAGVGSKERAQLGGIAFGNGINRQILDAYDDICHHWSPGDRLFVFGFSRGAFAARSLCNFLALVGHLDAEQRRRGLANDAFSKLYLKSRGHSNSSTLSNTIDADKQPIDVTLLGAFDTVSALDLWSPNGPVAKSHDIAIGTNIAQAYQALALDESHRPFAPHIWSTPAPGTISEQCWFAGGHGDVGGGHGQTAQTLDELRDNQGRLVADRVLACVPLLWMIEKSRQAGLLIQDEAVAQLTEDADEQGPQHIAPPTVSRLASILIGNKSVRQPSTGVAIHPSVTMRIGQTVEYRHADGSLKEKRSYALRMGFEPPH